MKVEYLGEAVRQRRKMLGVSQELVCDGLCTPMTLSRFESGRQTPSRDCVAAILQRLGLSNDQYYAHLTREETQLARLKREMLACSSQFEKAFEKNRQQARIAALEKLRDLERCVREDDHINQQFILRMKVTLEVCPSQEQMETLMRAIHLTSPRFDLDALDKCLYSTTEVILINKVAIRHANCGQRRKAIDIYEQLLKLLLKRAAPDDECLHLIAYNYARYLGMENRLEEALEAAKVGHQVCIKQGRYYILPKFLHIEAECYYLMGETNRSVELYRSAYYIYGAIMDTRNQEFLKADAKERFDLTF